LTTSESNLSNPEELLAELRNRLKGQLPFPQPKGTRTAGGVIEGLIGLVDNDSPDIERTAKAFQDRFNTVLNGLALPGQIEDSASIGRLKQILGGDIASVLSLATIANAIRDVQNRADIPHAIEEGLLAYFFSADGYKTVDGESVVAPVHLSDVTTLAEGANLVGPGPDVRVNARPVKQLK